MKTAVFFCAVAIFSGVLSAQVKPHDYTETNKSLQRDAVAPKQNTLTDQRARADGKTFRTKTYNNTKDASALIDKSFYYSDKKPADISAQAEFSGGKKEFSKKTFEPKKTAWFDSEKKQTRFDTSVDLSKTYKGKIDMQKRTKFDTDRIQSAYEQIQERSMQDINKYQFRHSHPTDPGIKITRAGGKAGDVDTETRSFFDAFSSRRRIDINTPAATLKGAPKAEKPYHSKPNAGAKAAGGGSTPKFSTSGGASVSAQTSNAPHISDSDSTLGSSSDGVDAAKSSRAQHAQHAQEKRVKSVEYLDESKSSQYNFLRVPDGMKAKGRAVIKVETDE